MKPPPPSKFKLLKWTTHSTFFMTCLCWKLNRHIFKIEAAINSSTPKCSKLPNGQVKKVAKKIRNLNLLLQKQLQPIRKTTNLKSLVIQFFFCHPQMSSQKSSQFLLRHPVTSPLPILPFFLIVLTINFQIFLFLIFSSSRFPASKINCVI